MFKKITATAFVFLIMSGCGKNGMVANTSKALDPDFSRYEDKVNGYQIDFPKDWEEKEGSSGTNVIALSPLQNDQDMFRENVNVTIRDLSGDGSETSLKATAEAAIEDIRTILKNVQVETSRAETINGMNGWTLVYTGSKDDFNGKFKQFVIFQGGHAYAITYSAAATDYTTFESDAQKSFNSFTIL